MADLVKKVKLEIVADDADAEARLDRITAKADELRAEHPELTVRIDTAEATAKMAIFREELKAATRPVDEEIKLKVSDRSIAESEAKIGILTRLLRGGSGSGGGLLGSLNDVEIPFVPGSGPVAIGLLGAAIATLLPELTALVSGFAAATAGAGAFGLLALPTFDKIKNAYTAISTAQAAYNTAVEKERLDPTKANATAVKTALLNLKTVEDQMAPLTRTAVSEIHNLVKVFDRAAKALQPDVFKVFNDGLKIANELLPDLQPLAKAAFPAIDGLMKSLGSALKTSRPLYSEASGHWKQIGTAVTPFGQFLDKIKALEGPSITAIGHGIGDLLSSIGKLLTVMSKKDVVNGINIAFAVLSGTIRAITWTVSHLMGVWDQVSRAVVRGWQDIRQWSIDAWHAIDQVVHNIVHAWDNVKHATDNVVHAFDNVRHFVAVAVTDVWHAIDHVVHDIVHAFDNVKHATDNVIHAFDNVRHFIAVAVTDIRHAWDQAVTDVEHWYHDVVSWFGKAVTWVKGLPGKIISALGNLGSMLFKAGANAISGLLSGMSSMVGRAISDAENWGHDIINALGSPFGIHFSEPSQATKMIQAGRNIALGLGTGIRSGTPGVAASAAALARAAGISGAGGAGGGGQLVLMFQPTGNALIDAIGNSLKGYVRTRGGAGPNSVQRALGQAI